MSLVDYGSSDDDDVRVDSDLTAVQPQKRKLNLPPPDLAKSEPRKINLASFLPKAKVQETAPREEFLFRTEEDKDLDAEENEPSRKRHQAGLSLAELLPAPTRRQQQQDVKPRSVVQSAASLSTQQTLPSSAVSTRTKATSQAASTVPLRSESAGENDKRDREPKVSAATSLKQTLPPAIARMMAAADRSRLQRAGLQQQQPTWSAVSAQETISVPAAPALAPDATEELAGGTDEPDEFLQPVSRVPQQQQQQTYQYGRVQQGALVTSEVLPQLVDPRMPTEFRHHLTTGAQVVEVTQQQLTHDKWNPHAAKAIELEQPQMSSSSSDYVPSMQAKRGHHISYLAHHAQQLQQTMLETRLQNAKSKAQTQAKYGW